MPPSLALFFFFYGVQLILFCGDMICKRDYQLGKTGNSPRDPDLKGSQKPRVHCSINQFDSLQICHGISVTKGQYPAVLANLMAESYVSKCVILTLFEFLLCS